ncbi:hypothetical protein yc1106_05289 [Curvularia clavata]|uniref:Carrier domain-containing protein n=1 Tax=Curvularia clavata TaxID=95742 RepID=A0A9Q8Z991_CURCL|nr:hypothetical protein yc1106_05289 [Curvularia clavata]
MQRKNLYNAFNDQAMRSPCALAVNEGDICLSYKQLKCLAESVAQLLLDQGLEDNEVVGIRYGPGVHQILCQIGVSLANGVCFPVDPSLPEARIEQLFRQARVRYAFSYDGFKGYVETSSQIGLVAEGSSSPKLHQSTTTEEPNSVDGHVTHILHTSGTTGKPKLVQITGSAILHLASSTDVTPLRSNDKTLCLNNPSFDLSLFEVWVSLLSGAEIIVAPKTVTLDGSELQDFISRKGATVGFLSTSHFHLIAFNYPQAFSSLRLLLVAGSALNPAAIKNVLKNNPPQQVWNAYGPTEATTFVTLHLIDHQEAEMTQVAIGKAVGDMQVILLNKDGRRITKEEELGEICISGPGLSIGYLDGTEEDQRRFLNISNASESEGNRPLLFKTGDLGYFRKRAPGVLVYVGRNDRQIKHNNYRVEPSEIESTFIQSQMVQDVCVLHVKASDSKSGPLLVACVLSQEDDMNKITDLREYGLEHLPAYMVPDQIIYLEEFPLNSRGKIDYAALENEVSNKLSSNNTRTQGDTRSMLEKIWRDVLGIHAAHEDDDFFDLGATSLQAADLTVKIRQNFGKFISLQDLYNNSRFGETLRFIESANNGEATEKIALIERLKTDSYLADDIIPSSGSISTVTGIDETHIFLTGATGFLGSYFLKHLSCTVATKSRVTCLIRSRNNLSAKARLREALRKYDLWDDKIEAHVSVVDGDLATHHFGLADEEHSRLARSVSVIYHFGAHVNFCQPYQTHFEANVLGTKNVLDFASNGMPKTIHYASTIDAWGATGLVNGTKSLLEDEALEPHIQGPLHDTGYSQSQWVAESLMRRARDRGFLVSIYRLGTVICDSERGAGNPNDFFARVAMGSVKLGVFPLIEDLRWEYVTVDYACAAIYHISRSSLNVGRSYSIVSPDPKQSVSLERTGKLLHEAGYPVKLVPYQEWVKAVSEDENLNDSPLLALMPLLREPVLGELTRFETSQKTPIYRTDNTKKALTDAVDIIYVPLSADMFRRMFYFWVKKGYYAA